MDNSKAIVVFRAPEQGLCVDLEIPLNITANELVVALNAAYKLGIDVSNVKNCYLKAERPIALLRGSKTLEEYGVRNGTTVIYSK